MGWKRLPGSSRHYLNTETEQEVTYRQYIKITRGTSFEAIRAERRSQQGEAYKNHMTKYNQLLSDYITNKETEGKKISRGEARRSSEMKQIVRDLKGSFLRDDKGKLIKDEQGRKQKDTSADGPLVKALLKLGRRKPDWHFPVGETPSGPSR